MPKPSRVSGRRVGVRARMREQPARDSLQIAQIAEVSLPARVEVLAARDPCGVVVRVQRLVYQTRQLLARPRHGSHRAEGVAARVRGHQGE
jgi:hypothetical protein